MTMVKMIVERTTTTKMMILLLIMNMMLHLGGEDVAGAPCDISTKLKQSLNQDGGLSM